MEAQEGTAMILGHSQVTLGGPSGAELEARLERGDYVALQDDCRPVVEIMTRIGDKWSVLLLMLLGNGPKRFNEMRRLIGGISQRMLTLTLRGLERDGLVSRTVFASVPPRVDYALTELGHSLRQPISALGEWAYTHRPVIEHARDCFDQRQGSAPAVPTSQAQASI
jgi:DNA-binding HxlR family transcriptional regulator